MTTSIGLRSLATLTVAMVLQITAVNAANLVTNPDFNTDINGWSNAGTAAFNWDGSDGSPSSGSANFVGNSNQVGFANSSCIVLAAPQNVDLYANVKADAGQAFNAEGLAYTDASCMNGENIFGAITSTPLPDPGWQEVSVTNIALPGGTQSVLVRLVATPLDVNLNVHVDHIRFGPAGTTPVRLQSFEVQ